MRTVLMHIGATLLCCILWAAAVFAALDQGWGHAAVAKEADAAGFAQAARAIAEEQSAGNLSFVLIEGGEAASEFHLSKAEQVDAETVFQVASLGKWLTSWGVMSLVEEGKLDLDRPVSDYLSRWQLPASQFDNSGVTVRR
ncbi:MAG: serine hydrolase domain-containing protein, partial [Pseudomonadota bacterium]